MVALLASALLWWGFVAFAFYGVCEDNCDKPPRAIGPAILAGFPFAFLGLLIMVIACYLLMRDRRPSILKAIGLGVYSSAGFVAGLSLLYLGTDAYATVILGMPLVAPLWLLATVALTRGGASPRTHSRL